MGFQIFTADSATERGICKKKKKKKKGMKNALEKRSAVMKKKGVNRKCVKDETTCHREGSEARREKLREP